MAAVQLAIHIPPEATPENITALLQAMIESDAEIPNVDALIEFMMEQQIGSRTEIQGMAERMGLLDKQKGAIRVSERGRCLGATKQSILPDLYHFLLYTSWHETEMLEFMPSWAYRYICDYLWQRNSLDFSDETIDILVSETIESAEDTFTRLEVGEINGVSFSPKSIRGARKWLDALTPPVIEKNVFSQRSFCAPELLLLAIGWGFRDEPDPLGVPLLLSRPRRERICRLCLLDPQFFERALDWLLPRFPQFITSEDKAGFYGRSIRLRQMPRVEDFAS